MKRAEQVDRLAYKISDERRNGNKPKLGKSNIKGQHWWRTKATTRDNKGTFNSTSIVWRYTTTQKQESQD